MMRQFQAFGRISAGLRRRSLQLDDHRVVYSEGGSGPTVLLLHGFGADKDTWNLYARWLVKRYRLVIPDLPGWGEITYHPHADYGYGAQVARLKALVDALGLGPLHLCGNSMGGAIAGVYAATHPQDVSTLLLMDAAALEMPNPSEFQRMVDSGAGNPLIVRSVADVAEQLRFVFTGPRRCRALRAASTPPCRWRGSRRANGSSSRSGRTRADCKGCSPVSRRRR